MMLSSAPIILPCSHFVCGEHFHNVSSQCSECEQVFDVPRSGFATNSTLANLLASEMHLSDEEIKIRHSIQNTIQQLEILKELAKSKNSEMELASYDHFLEIQRQIDLHREQLKIDNVNNEEIEKIDEIALKLIDQTKVRAKTYASKLEQIISGILDSTDFANVSQLLAHKFRNPNLQLDEVKCLNDEYSRQVTDFEARIKEFDSVSKEIMSLIFKAGTGGFQDEKASSSFGYLKAKEVVAITSENTIKIYNLDSNEHMATLEGHHTYRVYCLENIDKNRFASGSIGSIKIWDTNTFVCLKILKSRCHLAMCLKSLPLHRLASSAMVDIKIWNIESGQCLQTLNGHSDWINSLVYLPNGSLTSCSNDKTIKVWDLVKGECLKTLTGHTKTVFGLVLLRNGQLASSSFDKTIKIWNTESATCVRTLEGHSSLVLRLNTLGSGELVSCSFDHTIKIWKAHKGKCIGTLVGHTGSIIATRVNVPNCQYNTFVSYSEDGTIKTWNLKTGQCVNTLVLQTLQQFSSFAGEVIFI